ncbi:MAG: UvrD-helicase domain-containing protein, partial [Eubacterium sp.]|nr:UvrD-helicase domain-containing protein [Eubacterium sp.]
SKNKRLNPDDLYRINADRKIVDLINPVFSSYQDYLKSNNLIDFTDMLNHATDLVVEKKFQHVFKCVIIDEYQDISASQYQMLKALRNQSDYSLFAVGDDWQSIYRFAGSDIGYITNFDDFWKNSEISLIETTYRFSQRLSDISSDFIMQNPNQGRKRLRSGKDTDKYVIGHINGYTEKSAMHFMAERVRNLPQNSTVFFLGRYQFDIDLLKDEFELKYDNRTGVNKVKLGGRADLNMSFYTVHKSKGLQADYVFIINNRNTYMGFPSKVQNPDIIEQLLEKTDDYPDSEERRLFYVALTRARRKVFLVTADNKVSSFACEMIRKYRVEVKKEAWICPLCGGSLRKVKGANGEFYGCSNYPECKYSFSK